MQPSLSPQIEPSRLLWLANRLRCMSVAEVGYRIRRSLGAWLTRRRVLRAPPAMLSAFPRGARVVHPDFSGVDATPYVREADAILAGRVALFADLHAEVGSAPDWHRNPLFGMDAGSPLLRRARHGADGDVRYLWELNRHLQWVRLAQAWLLTGDARHAEGLTAQLGAWLDQCPPLRGPNWESALELAIRLVNWSIVWQLVGGWESELFQNAAGEQLRSRWLASIFAHSAFIDGNLSRYSSANNHLVGELTGLYVAARTWPFWPQTAAWAKVAKAALEREAALQHAADGGNREQAFAYQAFTCECLIVAGLFAAGDDAGFSHAWWRTLERALRFLRAFRDASGNVPRVGDADDGAVLRLEPRSSTPHAAIVLNLGEAVVGARSAARDSDTVRWLLGAKDDGVVKPANECQAPVNWKFPDSGYYFFGSRFGEQDEIKGMVDCGPLGYLGIAAHGHADALSIWLSIAGEPCLVDGGTFTYGGDYRWRAYFRGTSAHNTVRVDGADQSVSGGRFIWTRKAQARVEKEPASTGQFDFVGSHNGYLRLRDPVRHVRRVVYDDTTQTLLVRDMVDGKASHEVEQFWHFAPTVQVVADGGIVVARGRRFELHIQFVGGDLKWELIHGNADLPLGWTSRSYGIMEPASAVRVRAAAASVCIEARFTVRLI